MIIRQDKKHYIYFDGIIGWLVGSFREELDAILFFNFGSFVLLYIYILFIAKDQERNLWKRQKCKCELLFLLYSILSVYYNIMLCYVHQYTFWKLAYY